MSEPEIDRRCKGCGASVRPRALFCPQCGHPIANTPISSEANSEKGNDNKTIANNATVEIAALDAAETQPLIAARDLSETQPLSAMVSDASRTSQQERPRTAIPARGADENLGRVGKLRKVSSVVIDQAAYDPSLRFILVAAGLFLMFLFLLVLNKILG